MGSKNFMDQLPAVKKTDNQLLTPLLRGLLFFAPVFLALLLPKLGIVFNDSRHRDFIFEENAVALQDRPTTDTVLLHGQWNGLTDGLLPKVEAENTALEISAPTGNWDSGEIEIAGALGSKWIVRLTRELQAPDGTTMLASTRLIPPLETDQPRKLTANDLPGEWNDTLAAPMRLTIEPAEWGVAVTGGDVPLLRRVNVRFAQGQLNRLPYLPDILAMALLPFLAAFAGRVLFGWSDKRGVLAGVGMIVIIYLFSIRAPSSHPGGLWALAAGLMAATAAHAGLSARGTDWLRRNQVNLKPAEWRRVGLMLAAGAILLLGFALRWSAFESARPTDLGWDASGYVQIAHKGGALYDTDQDFAPWVREPLFPWILRAWFAVAPDTDASARVLTMGISLAALLLVFAAGFRLFGLLPALVGALVYAALPEWVEMSVRVLRHDLLIGLLMTGLLLRARPPTEKPWKRVVPWGVWGAALLLTQISGLLLVVFAVAWQAWRQKWQPAEIALAAAIAILPVVPHLAHNYQTYGDAMYSSTVHTRFYLNREFAGEPGFPTPAEIRADPYVGEPISTAAYFVQYHSVPELIVEHAHGYWKLFVWGAPRLFVFHSHEWLMLPGLLGAWAFARERRWWWIAAWFVVAAFPFAFISAHGANWRLGGEAMFFSVWIWALGVGALGKMNVRLNKRERKLDGSI